MSDLEEKSHEGEEEEEAGVPHIDPEVGVAEAEPVLAITGKAPRSLEQLALEERSKESRRLNRARLGLSKRRPAEERWLKAAQHRAGSSHRLVQLGRGGVWGTLNHDEVLKLEKAMVSDAGGRHVRLDGTTVSYIYFPTLAGWFDNNGLNNTDVHIHILSRFGGRDLDQDGPTNPVIPMVCTLRARVQGRRSTFTLHAQRRANAPPHIWLSLEERGVPRKIADATDVGTQIIVEELVKLGLSTGEAETILDAFTFFYHRSEAIEFYARRKIRGGRRKTKRRRRKRRRRTRRRKYRKKKTMRKRKHRYKKRKKTRKRNAYDC